MAVVYLIKDPNATLPYSLDWTQWLNEKSDILESYEIIVDGVDLVDDSEDNNLVTARVSGGTLGDIATITYRIVTTGGLTDDRSIKLRIEHR